MFKFIAGLLRHLWRLIDGTRKVIANVFMLIVLAIIVAAILHPGPTVPAGGAALLVRPAGNLVEQGTLDESLSFLSGEEARETVLPGLLEAIRAAKNDARIKLLVLETDGLESGGFAKLSELREAIADFKTSGKPVLARGERFGQGQYYLASIADELHLDPDGFVLLRGLALQNLYFRDVLDKLGIKMHLFRSGEYKSFAEPFTRNDMSKEDREASQSLLDGLWGSIGNDIAAARKLTAEQLNLYVTQPLAMLRSARGDHAQVAKTAGLVDQLTTRGQWLARLREQAGASGTDYRHIDASSYLGIIRNERSHLLASIAVLVAQGEIVDGNQASPGIVGGDSFAQLIKEARENNQVKALVIRIDSPGGSAWASEVIRQELEATRKAGKPVVVSMSSVAASGGYWIATAADEIFASPLTITGSIGVFGMLPEFSGALGKLGIGVDGVTTSPLAGAPDLLHPLDPAVVEMLQRDVDHTYQRFLSIVADARKMKVEAVDKIARGRVWTGQEAVAQGLVDQSGGLDAAMEAAAKRAGLDRYTVVWPAQQVPFMRMLWRQMRATGGEDSLVSPINTLVRRVTRDLQSLVHWNDPLNVYTHCLCETP